MYEQNNKRGAVAMDREREHGLLYTLLKASSVSLCLLGSPIYICSYKIFGCLIHIRRIPRKQIKKSDFKCQCKKIPTYFEHKKIIKSITRNGTKLWRWNKRFDPWKKNALDSSNAIMTVMPIIPTLLVLRCWRDASSRITLPCWHDVSH